MNRRHKALVLAAVLCCAALPALAGGLLGFEAPGSQRSLAAVLYFRYQDSPWLGQELRQLEVSHTQSLERALVEALQHQVTRIRERREWTKLECLELLFVAGWANKDVAAELRLSEQQVANFKFDFLANLRRLIRNQGLSPDVFPELYEE